MDRIVLMLGLAGLLTACGQSSDTAANQAAARTPAPQKKKSSYCFFKDPETKGWAASRGKDGDIVVKGKAYRSDPRYQAVLGTPTVTGNAAEVSPIIQQNATGYAAPENWWDLTATIPNSAAVTSVKVSCGSKTLAEFNLPTQP